MEVLYLLSWLLCVMWSALRPWRPAQDCSYLRVTVVDMGVNGLEDPLRRWSRGSTKIHRGPSVFTLLIRATNMSGRLVQRKIQQVYFHTKRNASALTQRQLIH
jgi:hypothetical protein